MIPKYYVIEMLTAYDTNINDNKYYKGQRLMVWQKGNRYYVCNTDLDAIDIDSAKQIFKVTLEGMDEHR